GAVSCTQALGTVSWSDNVIVVTRPASAPCSGPYQVSGHIAGPAQDCPQPIDIAAPSTGLPLVTSVNPLVPTVCEGSVVINGSGFGTAQGDVYMAASGTTTPTVRLRLPTGGWGDTEITAWVSSVEELQNLAPAHSLVAPFVFMVYTAGAVMSAPSSPRFSAAPPPHVRAASLDRP